MKFAEIEKVFTGNAYHFLADGWAFHTASMSGHQGEIAKVDFQKNGDVIRVMLGNDGNSPDNEYSEYMEISIRRYAGKARRSGYQDLTLWNGNGEVLAAHKYYKVAKDWFVESENAFGKIRRKRNERYDAGKIFDRKLGERCNTIAWRWVKRNRKKSARLSDIVGVYRKSNDYNGYLIVTKNGNYFIDMAIMAKSAK